jgi:hypothetical protein
MLLTSFDVITRYSRLVAMKVSLFLSLPLVPAAPTLEHRASVKRFVSLQFLKPNTFGRTPWTGDQPVAKPLPTQDNTE